LQGRYVEIGINNNGSFGACNATSTIPVGYHPHLPGTFALAEVYDYGHDGWAVGAPPFMGDYTYPGSPFEGWELQIGTGRRQAFQNCAGTMGATGGAGMTMTGTNSTYSNTGGRAIGTWTGTATYTGGVSLAIRQQTRVDTMASCVVVTTVLKNTSAAVAPNVYYHRSCDPDNDQSWAGGGFFTNNTIVHQNQDATHKVLVSSVGAGYPASSYMGLGTKDCRAKCFIYNSWSISSAVDLAATWAGTYTPATYALGATSNGDIAIGLTYNIGNIPAGDSAIVSYAYIWNGNTGIDSAFPDPQIMVNGIKKPVVPVPHVNNDTFDVCGTGILTFPVNLLYADDKSWSWSTWTWSPAAGLASTTGVNNTINVAGLPASITYTITGTDSAAGMGSCLKKTFYLTIKSCNTAVNNSPCEGDTLKFNRPGDSTLATYQWSGPAPLTAVFSTLQAPWKYPATLTDEGLYTVVKTVGTVTTTDTTRVYIRPKPTGGALSNIPACAAMQTTLTLTANVTPSAGTTYQWSGPGGFTSTLQFPTFTPFTFADTGDYVVVATTSFGCKDTFSTFVYPGPIPSFTTEINRNCTSDSVLLKNTSDNAITYVWNFGDGTTVTTPSLTPDILHIYPTQGIYTITLTAKNDRCNNPTTRVVDTRHSVTADFDAIDDTVCLGTAISFANLSTATVGAAPGLITSSVWDFGDGSPTDNNVTPAAHTYTAAGVYAVTLTGIDSITCESEKIRNVYVLQPAISGLTDTSICFTMPFLMENTISLTPPIGVNNYVYDWTGTDVSLLSSPSVLSPNFMGGVGVYTYTLTAQLMPWGCAATHTVTINSIEPAQFTNVTTEQYINFGESVQLNANNMVYYTWAPNDGSLTNNNINNPVATPTVTTVYAVLGFDIHGCRDTAWVIVHVDSSMQEFIPTGFTPNGDGKNDIFRATFLKFQRLVEFRIFNRWGQQVFMTSNKDEGWDGKLNGVPQDMGTYFYQIIVSRPGYGDNTVYKGEVTLIR
jgi:gliding motility-associated-like protein